MSINLESELRMNLKAMMCDMQSPDSFKSLDEKKEIIEKYVQALLDMLQESYGQEDGGAMTEYKFETGAQEIEAQAVDIFIQMHDLFSAMLPFDRFLQIERIWYELMRPNLRDEVDNG